MIGASVAIVFLGNVALELNIVWFIKLFVSHATISRAMVSCHRGAAEHACHRGAAEHAGR